MISTPFLLALCGLGFVHGFGTHHRQPHLSLHNSNRRVGPNSSKKALHHATLTTTSTFRPLIFPSSSKQFVLRSKSIDEDDQYYPRKKSENVVDEYVRDASRGLRRSSWLSWWCQVILSTISAVTLLFAKSVLSGSASGSRKSVGVGGGVGGPGFFFAGCGIALSTISIFWTWGGARLSRRLLRRKTSRISAANMIRRVVSFAVTLNLFGMASTLIGAFVIIGQLSAKAVQPFGTNAASVAAGAAVSVQTLQPLDILVVQGNANVLLSHFLSLVFALALTRYIDQLDPPSIEEKTVRK